MALTPIRGTAHEAQMKPENLRSIVARFPKRAFDLRKRCARDEHFRSVCGDYEEAAAAFHRFQSADGGAGREAADYAHLLKELEVEILDLLDRPEPTC